MVAPLKMLRTAKWLSDPETLIPCRNVIWPWCALSGSVMVDIAARFPGDGRKNRSSAPFIIGQMIRRSGAALAPWARRDRALNGSVAAARLAPAPANRRRRESGRAARGRERIIVLKPPCAGGRDGHRERSTHDRRPTREPNPSDDQD